MIRWKEFNEIWKVNKDIPIKIAAKLNEERIKKEENQIKTLLEQQKWPVMTLEDYEAIHIGNKIED